MEITIRLTVHLLRDILVVSSLGLLEIKLLMDNLKQGFIWIKKFHFSEVNAQGCDCWVL